MPKEYGEPLRLQKYIAECGFASRRKAEELIVAGKVRVNGKIVKELGTKVTPGKDSVQVRNQFLRPPDKGIVLFNKPKGVVSTLSDPEGRPCIADYLTKHFKSYYPVGRLDWDSTGLMILTNDGEIAERLMHPRYGFVRTYHVRVEGEVPEAVLAKIDKGVRLPDGMVRAKVDYVSGEDKGAGKRQAQNPSTWLSVTVSEGRNRLVRRLMERLGFPVMKLKRVKYGPFQIGRLDVGQMRKLTDREFERVRGFILGEERKKKGGTLRPKPRSTVRRQRSASSPRDRE